MKTLVFFFVTILLLSSCDMLESLKKDKEHENPCQIVSSDLVPQQVKDSVSNRYPGTTPKLWWNKDGTGFCVNFINESSHDITALFTTTGVFVSAEQNLQSEQTGQHEDSQPDTAGCSCEIEKSDTSG